MEFGRTNDLALVTKILTSPDVYEYMGDDYTPPREEFEPVIVQLNAELFDAPMPAPAGPSPVSPPAVKTT